MFTNVPREKGNRGWGAEIRSIVKILKSIEMFKICLFFLFVCLFLFLFVCFFLVSTVEIF